MTLEQKKQLYRALFPEVLAKRMCDQMDSFHVVNKTNSIPEILAIFVQHSINSQVHYS